MGARPGAIPRGADHRAGEHAGLAALAALGGAAGEIGSSAWPAISDTVGHKSTHVTETVYRHVIVPAIRGGATVMDGVFYDDEDDTNKGNEEAETS
jgi:hypothetical protein